MHTDIGMHGCATAVTMRLARDLLTHDAETFRGCDFQDGGKERIVSSEIVEDTIQVIPFACKLMISEPHQLVDPAPAFLDLSLWYKHLKGALCPALVIDQCSIAFRERGSRERHIRAFCRRILQRIDRDQVLSAAQKVLHKLTIGSP